MKPEELWRLYGYASTSVDYRGLYRAGISLYKSLTQKVYGAYGKKRASLRKPSGSEPGYRRPVAIIQADDFTMSRIDTIISAVVTSNTRLTFAPGNVFLRRREAGVQRDSGINVSQLLTLNKSVLTERIGRLSPRRLHELDAGLRLVLAL